MPVGGGRGGGWCVGGGVEDVEGESVCEWGCGEDVWDMSPLEYISLCFVSQPLPPSLPRPSRSPAAYKMSRS